MSSPCLKSLFSVCWVPILERIALTTITQTNTSSAKSSGIRRDVFKWPLGGWVVKENSRMKEKKWILHFVIIVVVRCIETWDPDDAARDLALFLWFPFWFSSFSFEWCRILISLIVREKRRAASISYSFSGLFSFKILLFPGERSSCWKRYSSGADDEYWDEMRRGGGERWEPAMCSWMTMILVDGGPDSSFILTSFIHLPMPFPAHHDHQLGSHDPRLRPDPFISLVLLF